MPAPDKNYLQVLSDLENWGSYEISAQPRDISKLEGIRLLLKDLGNPENNFKIIHIAGTNGKGLTASIMSRLLCVKGFATGCYTSPHLTDIRERITLNDQFVARDTFTQITSIVLNIARGYEGNPYLSYFDVLTAIAIVINSATNPVIYFVSLPTFKRRLLLILSRFKFLNIRYTHSSEYENLPHLKMFLKY